MSLELGFCSACNIGFDVEHEGWQLGRTKDRKVFLVCSNKCLNIIVKKEATKK